MTDREKYRAIQDQFLSHRLIARSIRENGWDAPICTGTNKPPTYAEIRDMIHIAWIPFMIDFLRNDGD